MWRDIRADIKLLTRGQKSSFKRVLIALFNRGFKALLLYRVSHAAWRAGIPIVPLVLARVAHHLYSVDISHRANLGPGVVIVHGFGLVIGSNVQIEGQCWLFHGVTLGDRGSEWIGSLRKDGHPVVERGCMFGAGAKVLGPIRVGRNSVIGANAVVLTDVEPCSVMAGVPARKISQRPEMDENLRRVS